MRTEATEVQEKLPIHLSTTLRCYPHLLLYADFKEDFQGQHITNILEGVSPQILSSHEDFDLYRRLKQSGRGSLDSSELSSAGGQSNGPTGRPGNPGWKLDKWKFIPMVIQTLHEQPDKKWYVFVETDTYVFWSTLLKYLSALNHSQQYYIGSQMQIGDIIFAYGGSGFVLSNAAIRRAVDLLQDHQEEWEKVTDGHWAGDCVLGKALRDTETPVLWAWPRLWCYPTVSYHHMRPEAIKDIWEFEQKWLSSTGHNQSAAFLRHKDVFEQYIMPRIKSPKSDWDNESSETVGQLESPADCEKECLQRASCVQYAFQSDGNCTISSGPYLGEPRDGTQSGWIFEKFENFTTSMAPCNDESWII
ncbi:glycosyltransferase family 31 protein [Polychaeton citri CBS 116435]|uniref:N-acetylgalactosaminide beta-1,3-galactosyltransferase n=1 Tax=Polychaeton citri CBS 116435 TaxID=1314669 RepID=A0A9P4UNI9_9PEZI|nr:glycosyltransferase family 31 protein [Polychaeton citri CBS 116435]